MTVQHVDWRRWDVGGLTPRALSLFEYFYGLYLARTFAERGAIIRRATPPMVGTLWHMAREFDARFDDLGNGVGRFDMELRSPAGDISRDVLTFPAGWKTSYSRSTERALGHLFLKQLQARKKGGTKSGRTRRAGALAEQIEKEALRLLRSNKPRRQWRSIIASRVGCSPQYVGRMLARLNAK